jgi:asparagine synthetase B (glutamine-hydrolysing)
MCGIFGILSKEGNVNLTPAVLLNVTDALFKLSESRGREAAGLSIRTNRAIYVCKSPTSASHFINSSKYKQMFRDALGESNSERNRTLNRSHVAVIGHSRLATSGTQAMNSNNQPVIKDGIVIVHNGIIVNDELLWKQFPTLTRQFEVDTEVICALIRMFIHEDKTLVEAVQKTFARLEGSASIAVLFEDNPSTILATNTGSLYVCTNESTGVCLFASEQHILGELMRNQSFKRLLAKCRIFQIRPWHGCSINLQDWIFDEFQFDDKAPMNIRRNHDNFLTNVGIIDLSANDDTVLSSDPQIIQNAVSNDIVDAFDRFHKAIGELKRCTRCILPETMPFIEFDEKGVCIYCRSHIPMNIVGKEALKSQVDRYIRDDKSPDCIVNFSGGRDSSYCLYYVKEVLGMNPIAYTYDWGMVTDLARRNQARICGKLGIEHIIVSADIKKKRENIRKNIEAWLKKPDLGTVPLFMAGDKQFFYYANRLKKQTRVPLVIQGTNLYEKTDFKSGFCGVKPADKSQPHERPALLSLVGRAKLALYYGKHYLQNPAYLNSSLADTIFAFFSYYLLQHEFMNIYKYVTWDEKEITSTLINEYNWEIAKDTTSTWRIGDGTAPFYNYIYYVGAGFTENDTFRSNQIREGQMNREDALTLVRDENKPRYDSIIWYCDTVGIDFESTLKSINSMPKLYKL